MRMRLFTVSALMACALLMIAAPMIAQTRGATPDRTLQRQAIARTIQALRLARGVDYTIAGMGTIANGKHAGASILGAGVGSISGTVTMPVRVPDFASVIAVSTDSSKEEIFVGDAQSDGSYTIDGVPAGSFLVIAQSSLCSPEFYDNVSSPDSATIVAVADGRATTGIDFSLETIEAGQGSITGKVLTESGGDAIIGAGVWAMSLDNPGGGGWAEADARGDFVISGLVGGTYVLQASAPGFIPEFYDNVSSYELATPVSVSDSGVTSGVIFSLSPGATITGRVVDENGAPIAGVMIDAMPMSDPADSAISTPTYGSAVSDENGDYVVSGLDSGFYVVGASYWGPWIGVQEYDDDVANFDQATPVRADLNQTTSGIDFNLSIPSFDGVVSGVVLDTAGQPIEGAFVMLMASTDDFPMRAGASTQADGTYLIEGLPDGAFKVSAMAQSGFESVTRWWRDAETPDEADVVTIVDGQSDVASVDFELALDRGSASIAGTVRLADGSPVYGAMVGVTVTDPSDSTVLFGAQAMTDEYGAYVLPYLPDGSYLVYATHWDGELMGMEWYLDASDPSTATPVVLADDEARTGVDFSLDMVSYYGTISGRVTDDRTGAPIARAYIEISPVDDKGMGGSFGYRPAYALTDDDGLYAISGVPTGRYYVAVIGNGAFEYYDNQSHPDSATTVSVPGGESVTVDFGLSARSLGSGSITGRVFSNDNRPMDVGLVVAFPTNGTEETAFPTVAEVSGNYEISGLADGQYYVFAFAPEHIGEYYEDAWDVSTATVVTVSNGGATAGIDFGLDGWGCFPDDGEGAPGSANGGTVYGEVTDNGGAAIADANVYVVDANRKAIASVRTRADGSYEIAGLPTGSDYRVMASSVGYTTEYNGDARSFEEATPKQVRQGRTEVNFELSHGTSAVGDVDERTSGIAIAGSYPNPFAITTSVRFSLEKQMDLTVTVVDARGETVARLHDGLLGGGKHELRWNGSDDGGSPLESGMYFVRIANGGAARTVPVTLAR